MKNMEKKRDEYYFPLDTSRAQLYQWMKENSTRYHACHLMAINRDPKTLKNNQLSYVDAVEVALCFGWVDSTIRKVNGIPYRRFSPRKAKSHWTELNKERCRRLINLHQMTPEGRKVLPDLKSRFQEPLAIVKEIQKNKEAYDFFRQTPAFYQRIKLDNLSFTKERDIVQYRKSLACFLKACQKHKLYGSFDDYGRLPVTNFSTPEDTPHHSQ